MSASRSNLPTLSTPLCLSVNPPPTNFYTGELAKNPHPSPTVRQHTPTTPFHTLNLRHSEKPADVPYIYPRDLPSPSFLNTNFLAKLGNTLGCSLDLNRVFRCGRLTSQTPCYHLQLNSQFDSLFIPIMSPGLQAHPSTR